VGKAKEPARRDFIYVGDEGQVMAIRYDDWKVVFLEQRMESRLQIWAEPFTELRTPLLLNLRLDPFGKGNPTAGDRTRFGRPFG
jgi:arylsulfatase